jgi:hypothetical protein
MNPLPEWREKALPVARRWNAAVGPLGWTGLALAAVAVGLVISAAPLADRTEAVRASAQHTRDLLAAAQAGHSKQANPVGEALQLVSSMPASRQANTDLRRIFAAAKRANIAIAKGEYTLAAADETTQLRRLEVVLPVKDRYAAIKGFVAAVLNDLPNASLAELHIERGASHQEALDARIRFTLFYQANR